MKTPAPERILLIGDSERQVQGVLAQAMPLANITAVHSVFDGIAELSSSHFTAILAAAEPLEHRPEAAVRVMRQLATDARLVLFGHPAMEPLSRKMLELGCDDYVVMPASPAELHQVFGSPLMRLASPPPAGEEPAEAAPDDGVAMELSLAEILLDALTQHPHDAFASALRQLRALLAPSLQLDFSAAGSPPSENTSDGPVISQPVRAETGEIGLLHLALPKGQDIHARRHLLARLAELLGQLHQLQDRHNRLQKLAITDELTGLYNARYFRHFLARILERARVKRFPVTLFIFDIDNFKKYNDEFGHAVGDEILKATAALMRRSCREHDLVARIGGDEFAVVFWEKEGPRQPKEPKPGGSARTPQTPLDILNRFRRLLSTHAFPQLGPEGKGVLTISGGLAVYPYDARTAEELIEAADRQLMFKAKQAGKNSIFLVGSDERMPADER